MTEPSEESRQLVFDLFHEIGNLVAAIRLQAHLLDEDLGSLGLARASLEIEGLGARTSALLGFVRPLLAGVPEGGKCQPAEMLVGIEDLVRDVGLRGVKLEVECDPDPPEVAIDHHVLYPILSFLAADALEALGGKGELAIRARIVEGFVEFSTTDSADADPSLEAWETDGRRGRGLAVAAAQRLLSSVGGRARVERTSDRTCVALLLPPLEA